MFNCLSSDSFSGLIPVYILPCACFRNGNDFNHAHGELDK